MSNKLKNETSPYLLQHAENPVNWYPWCGEAFEKAEYWCSEAVKRFRDSKKGGFYLCKTDSTELFMNPKEIYDGAIPSGNAVMAYNFVRLHQLTEKADYEELSKKQIAYMSSQIQDNSTGHSMFLLALLIHENPPEHITVAVKDYRESDGIKERLPFFANISVVPESEKYPLLNGQTTYYICKNHNCLPPTNTFS